MTAKCDRYQKERQNLLQCVAGITKFDKNLLKIVTVVERCDTKLLKIVAVIAKCDSYYKVRRNNF